MMGFGGRVRAACGLGLALAVSGCSYWSGDPVPPVPPPPPSAAFDGRYALTIRPTGSSTGIDQSECASEPRMTIQVTDGRFTLTQHHRKLAEAAPTARDIATTIYEAEIADDGTITGMSDSNAAMRGRVENGRMSGDLFGLLCYFSFAGNKL